MSTTIHSLDVAGVGPVDVTTDQQGAGQPFVLLHGGAGPASVSGFAVLCATTRDVLVITPTHPGFGGSPRPGELDSIGKLARLYVGLLDELELTDVTVIGNSIGGWIAAEMLLLESPRITGAVLVGAVGIEVPGHPVADFFSLTMDEVFDLSYHEPERFRIDFGTLPEAARAIAAGNRAALAVYTRPSMGDPGLAERLSSLEVPTLVLSGESDRIVDPDYGRAYAAAIPGARFQLLAATGHVPQLETPDLLLDAIWNSVDPDFSSSATDSQPEA